MKGQCCKWILLGLLLLTTPLQAYWSETHQKFADAAFEGNTKLSGAEENESMADYYANRLGFPLDSKYIFNNVEALSPIPDFITKKDNGFVTWTVKDEIMAGTEILIQGADDEDYPVMRASNHFFDPVHNQSLAQSIDTRKEYFYQYDDGAAGATAWFMEAIKTPDWALEDNGEAPSYQLTDAVSGETVVYSRQIHSLRDSYDYLYKALTSTDLEIRKKQMGAHIYALGHVIHLLTDMGQPEHVRNDVHLASAVAIQANEKAEA